MNKSGDKLNVLKLSVSSIKNYESCPRKYYFTYINKPDIPKKEQDYLILGNFIHEVLEFFHNMLMKDPSRNRNSTMTFACKAKEKETDRDGKIKFALTEDLRKTVRELLFAYLAYISEKGLPNVQANEKKFAVQLGDDVVIRGVIDRVDVETVDGVETPSLCDYKGLAIDTPIPTPSGWTTMGELEAGDLVFGLDGKPTNVIIKSEIHSRPCFKLTFGDHSSIVCDNVHLWNIIYRKKNTTRDVKSTVSAEWLFENWETMSGKGFFKLPAPGPLYFSETSLPIDPWILGAWLGDGHSKSGSVTVGQLDLDNTEKIISQRWGNFSRTLDQKAAGNCKAVFTITMSKKEKDKCGYGHSKCDAYTDPKGQVFCKECFNVNNKLKSNNFERGPRYNIPLSGYLRNLNLLKNKHIPDIYMQSSFEQRVDLLRGLMDTDGYVNSKKKYCIFASSIKNFAKQVYELIKSLGVSAVLMEMHHKNGGAYYQIKFFPLDFAPFLLTRKLESYNLAISSCKGIDMSYNNTIKSIEPVESVPTQCISVDAEDHLYLASRTFKACHNTGQSKYLDEFQLLVYGIPLMDNHPELERYRASYLALKEDMKEISYTFTRTDVERTKEKIREIAKKIREDITWAPKPQFLCKYCDFETVCDAAPAKYTKPAQAAGGEIEW